MQKDYVSRETIDFKHSVSRETQIAKMPLFSRVFAIF